MNTTSGGTAEPVEAMQDRAAARAAEMAPMVKGLAPRSTRQGSPTALKRAGALKLVTAYGFGKPDRASS